MNKIKYIRLFLLISLYIISSCNQTEPLNIKHYNNTIQENNTDTMSIRSFELGLGSELENLEELRSLIFSNRNGNTPKIKDLTRLEDDKLLFYFFSDNKDGSPIHPVIKEIVYLSDTDYYNSENSNKEAYTIDTSSDKIRLRFRVNLPVEHILNTIKTKSWYMGAMLNGIVNNQLAPNKQAYQISHANDKIIERLDSTNEVRAIPLLSPIIELTKDILAESNPMVFRFSPKGMLFNFKLRNTTVHNIELLELYVKSSDIAFSSIYSLQDKHLRLALSKDKDDRYPIAVSGSNISEVASANGLKADDQEWIKFPFLASDTRSLISLKSQLKVDPITNKIQTDGYFTLWGIPIANKSNATIQTKIKYRVHYGDGYVDFESTPTDISIKSPNGYISEGKSYTDTNVIDIKEVIPATRSEIRKDRWMSYLPDDVTLKQLSLAGTHDTGANTGIATSWGQTQTLSIRGQLDAGIRYLDIRMKLDRGRFPLYHGPSYLGLDLENDVLNVIREFFRDHPSETIIMMLKAESGGGDNFRRALSSFLKTYNDKHQLFFTEYWGGNTKLENIRGKVLIMSREGYLNIGMETGRLGNNVIKTPTQNDFPWIAFDEERSLYEKIYWADIYDGHTSYSTKEEQIRNAIDAAGRVENSDYLIINHVNLAALIPTIYTPYRNANRLNKYTLNYLTTKMTNTNGSYPLRSGFIILDYVGEPDTRSIVEILLDQSLNTNNQNYRNFHKRTIPIYTD